MKTSSKIAIAALLIIVAIPLIVVLAAGIILNSTALKSEIENIVAETLEMDFKIEGRIGIRFFPMLNLAANKVTVGIKSGQIASADRVVIDPRLTPLLNLDVEIEKAHLQRPRLTFNPHAIEKIMALIDAESGGPLPVESLKIESFSISGAGFTYTDDHSRVDVNEMNFRGGRIDIIANREVIINDIFGFFKALEFTGDMAIRRIAFRNFDLENLNAKLIGKNGIFTADPVQLQFLGSETKLSASLDLTKPQSTFTSTLAVTGLDMKAMAAKYFAAANIRSKVDITAGISASGIQRQELIDYISTSDATTGTKKFPIKSVIVEAFTVATKDLAYSNDTVTIHQAELTAKGDRWALIDENRGTLTDFDGFLKATKFAGPLTIKSLTLPDHQFENLQAHVSNDHGIIKSDPIELEYFGEQARLGLDWDLRKNNENIRLRVDMPAMDIGSLLKRSNNEDILSGKLNIQAELETRAADSSSLAKDINGHVSLQGKNLTLKSVDIDKALDEFEKMGAYGFSDFAALITLGPLGAVVSNGYDQLDALEKMMAATGDSTIQQILSDWKITNGVADAVDVAFSTRRHRVAIKGKLDFPGIRFHEVTFAVVDPNGCIVNREIVDGPFDSPEVEETGVIRRTVIRPLKRFLKSDCEPFYDGSVAHPPSTQK